MNRLPELPKSPTNDALVRQLYTSTQEERKRVFDQMRPERVVQLTTYMCQHHERLFQVKKYSYLVTFTTTKETQEGAEEFLKLQPHRRGLYCESFAYTKEHEENNLHFHAIITTTKPIVKSDFQHWIHNRGHVDFKPIKDLSTIPDVINYLNKENLMITLKGCF